MRSLSVCLEGVHLLIDVQRIRSRVELANRTIWEWVLACVFLGDSMARVLSDPALVEWLLVQLHIA